MCSSLDCTNSTGSENSRVDLSGDGECAGFIVDVVKQLVREIPFQMDLEWLVVRRRTGLRRTDSAPVRHVLAGVRTGCFLH